MIGFFDSVRVDWPEECVRSDKELCSVDQIIKRALHKVEFMWEVIYPNTYRMYVDPRFYHQARAILYNIVPACVYVDVIPFEFTS